MYTKTLPIVSESKPPYGRQRRRAKSEASKRIQSRAHPDWNPERKNFMKMFDELMKTHKNKYVAIHGGRVVESGDDQSAVVLAAVRRFPNEPIFVDKVTREKKV